MLKLRRLVHLVEMLGDKGHTEPLQFAALEPTGNNQNIADIVDLHSVDQ